MKSINIVYILLVAMLVSTSIITIHANSFDEELDLNNDDNVNDLTMEEEEEDLPASTSSIRGVVSRMLAHKRTRVKMTCNKYPRVCHLKGSPGPDCCKKKCVNVKSDRHNCGKCGKKCKYSELCCKGKCVNPMKDKKHCGGCGSKCWRGNTCNYGFCNYA
ncbi:hypothetical protein ACFE04_003243 [Oxalis oulophora]